MGSTASGSGSGGKAARAFARVGWRKLLSRLHRYATATLRLAPMDAERAGRVEAADLVNTLVAKGLDGSLVWSLPESATDEEIVGYACTKMYGLRSTLRRKGARDIVDDALDERPDGRPDALAQRLAREKIEEMLRAFEDDADASAHLVAMLEGKKRAEIVKELGCTAEHAIAVRKRILRRIAKDDESGPPSSGSERSYQDEQATEE